MSFLKNLFYKTHSKMLTVTSSSGFHLRPVAQFVTEAKVYQCNITASFKAKHVNAKAIQALLSLNLEQGNHFMLTAKGPQAKEALKQLSYTFQTLMHSDKEVSNIKKTMQHYEGNILEGDIIAEGICIAAIYPYTQQETYTKTQLSFKEAITLSAEELEALYTKHQPQDKAAIYLAQKELLLALGLESSSLDRLEVLIEKECALLKDAPLASKISDYQDLLKRVKGHLGYDYKVTWPNEPFILLADDLLPCDIAALEESQARGVILKQTSASSHTAILLRSSGIASLLLDEVIATQKELVILDALAGVLVTNPSAADLKKAKEQQALNKHRTAKSNAKRFDPVLTTSKKRVHVLANVSDLSSAYLAREQGAEGIGLLRTEFLFNTIKPSLKKQQDTYEEIFKLFPNVTVRTLDVGGDKALPYVQIPPETNPFLGLRGVRLFRTHPDLLEEQLHAMFLAANHKAIKIMFPMVSSVEEFTKAKDFAQNIAKKHQLDISNIRFGIMIEVPSVLFLLEAFNPVVDFYSIGTNDLSQYLFAIERTHPILKIDPCSPVVFSVIESIVMKAKKPVSICGELAANTQAIETLIKLGVETLSLNPKSIAQTKEHIRHL